MSNSHPVTWVFDRVAGFQPALAATEDSRMPRQAA